MTVHLLDCTIRDGSYLIDYCFTAEDTYIIASALSRAGVERIEVGHGLGLDAQYRGKGTAAESDAAYIRAAVSAADGRAKIGVFYIPGIGQEDSIRRAADAGLSFIRVGTDVDEFPKAESAIKLAKELGLEAWSNLMKSYIVTPEEFGQICGQASNCGADIVALVDSAGGMAPNDIKEYARCAVVAAKAPLAFHGHNNLHLVHANCLAFAEEGGSFVDASLRGMGRSAGNAATEIIAALLVREGYDIGEVDWGRLMDLAENLIAPIMPRDTGVTPVAIATGISQFHSSFQSVVEESAGKVGVTTYETILQLGKESRKKLDAAAADKAANEAKRDVGGAVEAFVVDEQWIHRQACSSLEDLKAALKVLSAKSGFPIVMSMALAMPGATSPFRITPIRLSRRHCIGHLECASCAEAEQICDYFKEDVSRWMVDKRIERPTQLNSEATWIQYDDDRLILTAVSDLVELFSKGHRVYVPGGGQRLAQMARQFFGEISDQQADVGIALDSERPLTTEDVERVREEGGLIIVVPNAVNEAVLEHARTRGLALCRLDMREALVAEVDRLFATRDRLRAHTGSKVVDGLRVVAGGIIGEAGAYVVNSISSPVTILGKADGKGGIVPLGQEDDGPRGILTSWIFSEARRW